MDRWHGNIVSFKWDLFLIPLSFDPSPLTRSHEDIPHCTICALADSACGLERISAIRPYPQWGSKGTRCGQSILGLRILGSSVCRSSCRTASLRTTTRTQISISKPDRRLQRCYMGNQHASILAYIQLTCHLIAIGLSTNTLKARGISKRNSTRTPHHRQLRQPEQQRPKRRLSVPERMEQKVFQDIKTSHCLPLRRKILDRRHQLSILQWTVSSRFPRRCGRNSEFPSQHLWISWYAWPEPESGASGSKNGCGMGA